MSRSSRTYTSAYASLSISGPDFDPVEVTNTLQLPPDHYHRVGEARISRSKAGAVKVTGQWSASHWSMSSKAWVQSPRLETHIQWILEQVKDKSPELAQLTGMNCELRIVCYSFGHTPDPPSISGATRVRAEELGLEIVIDHYTA